MPRPSCLGWAPGVPQERHGLVGGGGQRLRAAEQVEGVVAAENVPEGVEGGVGPGKSSASLGGIPVALQ